MYFLSAGKDSKLQGQHITTCTVKYIFKPKTHNFQLQKEIHLDKYKNLAEPAVRYVATKYLLRE